MGFLLLFHCNNGCTNAHLCYVKPTLPVLLNIYGHYGLAGVVPAIMSIGLVLDIETAKQNKPEG